MPDSIALRSVTKTGTVAELHALPMPTEGDDAELWVMRPVGPAIAMGSSQRPEQFETERLAADGIELAPRRSGGGAVFIDPSSTVWIDTVAPRSSDFWSPDLGKNFLIVGRIWQQALRSMGVETELFTEAPARSDAAKLACWAGLGWGELTLGSVTSAATIKTGASSVWQRKIVGLSQRRTRWGVRVQAMASLNESSARVADYLPPADRRVVSDVLGAGSLGTASLAIEPGKLETAVLAAFRAVGHL